MCERVHCSCVYGPVCSARDEAAYIQSLRGRGSFFILSPRPCQLETVTGNRGPNESCVFLSLFTAAPQPFLPSLPGERRCAASDSLCCRGNSSFCLTNLSSFKWQSRGRRNIPLNNWASVNLFLPLISHVLPLFHCGNSLQNTSWELLCLPTACCSCRLFPKRLTAHSPISQRPSEKQKNSHLGQKKKKGDISGFRRHLLGTRTTFRRGSGVHFCHGHPFWSIHPKRQRRSQSGENTALICSQNLWYLLTVSLPSLRTLRAAVFVSPHSDPQTTGPRVESKHGAERREALIFEMGPFQVEPFKIFLDVGDCFIRLKSASRHTVTQKSP